MCLYMFFERSHDVATGIAHTACIIWGPGIELRMRTACRRAGERGGVHPGHVARPHISPTKVHFTLLSSQQAPAFLE